MKYVGRYIVIWFLVFFNVKEFDSVKYKVFFFKLVFGYVSDLVNCDWCFEVNCLNSKIRWVNFKVIFIMLIKYIVMYWDCDVEKL